MTNAVQPVGDYTIEGDMLKISVILVIYNQPIVKEIVVKENVSKAEKVMNQLFALIVQSL